MFFFLRPQMGNDVYTAEAGAQKLPFFEIRKII